MNRLKALTVVLVAFAFAALPWMTRQPGHVMAANGFTAFQLGDGPNLGVPGEVCPNSAPHPFSSNPPCTNGQGEPQIRANNAGEFYGASENGVFSGTEAYRSLNNAGTYQHLLSPDQTTTIVPASPGSVGPGGGDVDVAVAPQPQSNGVYNTYVASLSLANVTLSTSHDRGNTWKPNLLASKVPGDDREWVAADSASKVCVSYRDLGALGIHEECSLDAGTTFPITGDAIDLAHPELRTNFEIGNLAIDPNSHVIYQTFSSIAKGEFYKTPNVACNNLAGQPCQNHVVYMAVSHNGGYTFTDYVVHAGPPTVSYGHQFVNVSVDRAGNVYSVYSDDHNVYYSYSRDQGQTWTGPFQINTGTGGQQTAIMPWSTAGTDGRVAVVFYGANYYDGVHPPDNYPCNDPAHCAPVPDPNGPGTAVWNVFYSENLSATTNGHGFTPPALVTDYPVHYGGVCEGGVGCTGDRGHNRDLYDDFGVAVSPLTNTASIIFDSDRYFEYGHPSRLNTLSSQSYPCPATYDNTGSCTHTDIAVGQSHIFANAPGGGNGTGDGGGNT
ncbi:MAG: hypothetical protein NVS4B2_28810 [Chloroflexota bacterium]